MNTKEVVALIEKLIELTQKNIISWSVSNIQQILSDMEKVDTVFSVEYLGQNLRLYKYFYRFYRDEEEFDWLEDYRLETYDMNNHTLYVFPKTQNEKELMGAVMYQSSKIEEFYKNIMGQ